MPCSPSGIASRRGRPRIAPILRVAPWLLLCAGLLVGCGGPDGARDRRSHYVETTDGTRLAVDVWLPPGSGAEQPVPAVLRPTTRWRDFEMRTRPMLDRPIGWTVDQWNGAGYALVTFDARGTGASFGTRSDPWGIADAGDGLAIVDWIVAQAWSSGDVAVWGEQDDALLAEPLLAAGHPAIGAGILRFADWDLLDHRLAPGGLPLSPVLEERDARAVALDAGDPCGFSPRDCDEVAPLFLGPRAVDDDPQGTQRATAVARHDTPLRTTWLASRDVAALSPQRLAPALTRADVPTQLWAGWWEGATAASALRRYGEVDAPQQLIIGAFGPGGATAAAPGRREPTAAEPDPLIQFATMIAFVDRHLGTAGDDEHAMSDADVEEVQTQAQAPRMHPGGAPQRAAARWSGTGGYAVEVLGEGWLEGRGTWPPSTVTTRTLALDEPSELVLAAEGAGAGASPSPVEGLDPASIPYEVDFGAGTGAFGRYWGRLEARLAWASRADDGQRLLRFASEPLARRAILLGSPRLVVALAFEIETQEGTAGGAQEAAALHAYLEAVDPLGRVDLLSEGQLRLEDGPMQLRELELQPLAVALPTGMRLQLALAGHDRDAFARVPPVGAVRWRVDATRSRLELPYHLANGAQDGPQDGATP